MDRSGLKHELDCVHEAVKKCELQSTQLDTEFIEQCRNIDAFCAKLLVVGAFSAGKSALLNTFMGDKEILIEDITPETAIATELVYSDEAFATRVLLSDKEELCSIEDAKIFSTTDCKKYIFHLPVPILKELKNITIVDMPGFSSGIETHNKAIMQYIGEAAGYIFVVAADAGTIGARSEAFLREIQQYSPIIRFVLTKCDKNTESTNNKVAIEVKSKIKDFIGKDVELLQTASYFSDANRKLQELFTSIPVDSLLVQKVGGNICGYMEKVLYALQEQLEVVAFNPYEINKQLEANERSQVLLQEQLMRETKAQHQNMASEGMAKILGDVTMALNNNIGHLVSVARMGNERFGEEVNSILRPVLKRSMDQIMEMNYGNLLTGLVNNMNKEIAMNPYEIADKANRSIASMQKIVEMGAQFAKINKWKGGYKVLTTGGAVLTNFVVPGLELVIIFLPEIIGLVSKLFGESEESKIEKELRRNIIPQITMQLRPKIAEALQEMEDAMITDLEAQFNEKISVANDAIRELKDEKEKCEMDVTKKKKALQAGIDQVEKSITVVKQALEEVV